ncbi:hypothetical protein AB0H36_27550 [Kribbella sp. NPDC050820]|uniref:hypothetical protein n=1 Tax=Kribbella sp. NPDC050820 TaxID=3155408 RepID=UPI00340FF685
MARTYTARAGWIEIAAAGIYERSNQGWGEAHEPDRQRCRDDARSAIEALLKAMPLPTARPPASPGRSRRLKMADFSGFEFTALPQ